MALDRGDALACDSSAAKTCLGWVRSPAACRRVLRGLRLGLRIQSRPIATGDTYGHLYNHSYGNLRQPQPCHNGQTNGELGNPAEPPGPPPKIPPDKQMVQATGRSANCVQGKSHCQPQSKMFSGRRGNFVPVCSRGVLVNDGGEGEIRLEMRPPRWSRRHPAMGLFACRLAGKCPWCFCPTGIDCEFPAADNRKGAGEPVCRLAT